MPPEWSPRTVTFLGIRSRWLQSVILGIATLFAVASLGNVVYRGYVEGGFTGPRWGNDLDQWWAGGRLLLQGQNPYATKVPSAAPVLLLLTPLAALPWLAASVLWAVANLVLAVGCVWLMLRLNGGRLGSLAGALCLALFAALIATRQTLELGQISLLITACVLAALRLLGHRPWLAGVLLGVAVSKYTLAFPLLLICLWERRWKPMLAAALTQLAALLAVALVARTNPVTIIRHYLDLSTRILAQTQDYSVHLLSLGWGALGDVALLLSSAALIVVLVAWYRWSARRPVARHAELTRLTLLGALTMWSLYALYHGRQDVVFAFLFVVVVAYRPTLAWPPLRLGGDRGEGLGADQGRKTNDQRDQPIGPSSFVPGPSKIALTPREQAALNAFTWVVLAVWMLPLYGVLGLPLYRSVYAVTTVAVSLVWAWTLFRVSYPQSPISTPSRTAP